MGAATLRWLVHLRDLLGGTLKAWWACLPELVFGLVLGQVAYQGMLLLSAVLSEEHPWLAVGTLSLGFAGLLVGYLYCLRVLGRHLAVDEPILALRHGEPKLKESLTHLVAVTLLPFLGIYAVFGEIQDTSFALFAHETILRGQLSRGALTQLNPQTGGEMLVIAAVLAGTYVVRRSLEWGHERTGRRVFGFLTGIVETFFMLVLVFGGTRMIATTVRWLRDRQVAAWLDGVASGVADALRRVYRLLPDWVEAAWDWISGPLWDTFAAGMGSPLLWLAIAALAFGSRITSLGELWRTTIGRRVRIPAAERHLTPGVRRAGTEFKELFMGDVDDKYLPTWYSLRLILASGPVLIGAFCLLHALVSLIEPGSWWVLRRLMGPRDSSVWIQFLVGGEVATTLLMEPLRLSLLAVTFLHCLRTLARRAQEVQ